MITLDTATLRRLLGATAAARLAEIESFGEIDSTNSYLLRQPGPAPGRYRVAVTDKQTKGRGRRGRSWISPPGSGICLSVAYTFATRPDNLPALTLAFGIAVSEALEGLGVGCVQLKWPNDLVVGGGKLGGILTETQPRESGAITVVAGVGINVDLGGELDPAPGTGWSRRAADIVGVAKNAPPRETLAARLIDSLCTTFLIAETDGFGSYLRDWPRRDWLLGRQVTIDTARDQITGVCMGIAADGALLVDTGAGEPDRITSGSVVVAATRGAHA